MSEVELFSYRGHQLRTVQLDDEPWFVAGDACSMLTLKDTSSAVRMVDETDRRRLRRSDTQFWQGIPPQVQEITLVNESGLYALICLSSKPEAHEFRRWVNHKLLPEIRRTGRYGSAPWTQPPDHGGQIPMPIFPDPAPAHVQHPPWCPGGCHTTTAGGVREVVHTVETLTMDLGLTRPWTAVVALMRFDEYAPDGTLASSGPDTVVLDGPAGLYSLTVAEAARLGAALVRTARLAGGAR